MAKRRKKSSSARASSPRTQIVRTPAPIVNVRNTLPAKAKTKHRRRSGGSVGGGSGVRSLVNPALAGGAVGMLVKSGMLEKLPVIPVVGQIGAAAIGLSYFGGNHPMAREMARGCAFLAGFQLTSVGSVTGDDDVPADGYGS